MGLLVALAVTAAWPAPRAIAADVPNALSGTQTASADEAVITGIQVQKNKVLVTVRVPAGLKKLTLECRSQLGRGAWTPCAVARIDGTAGEIAFTIDQSENVSLLRVRGESTEPLPASFYAGTKSFAGQPSGSGAEALAPGAPVDSAGAKNTAMPPAANADAGGREVVESDIWQVSGDTLYFFNQYRGLQVVDLTIQDAPVLKGTLPMPASGEQMYVLPGDHVVLLARDSCNWWGNEAESQVLLVNVSQGQPRQAANLPVRGDIVESRLVGTALYVASQYYRRIEPVAVPPDQKVAPEQWEWGTVVTSFDLANPALPVRKSEVWTSGYGAVVTATDKFFFIANSDINNYWRSIVRVIDISNPDGTMNAVSSIKPAGRVPDKFKMQQSGEVFTVISEAFTDNFQTPDRPNGRWVTKIQTYSLTDPSAPARLGELEVGHGERLFATRFDGNRVYVVTFLRIDPLWVVDLSDPTKPVIHGELEIPGWSTYIHPMGDRLVAVGVETNRVAVQLFDVADPAKPGLLSKVRLGQDYSWSEANNDEKAFTVLPDAGLIMLPYSGNTAAGWASRVQLIDLSRDSLTARGFIEHDFQPRRATLHRERILSLSGTELLTVDAADRDKPVVKSSTELSWSADRLFVQGAHVVTLSQEWRNASEIILRVTRAAEPVEVLSKLKLPADLALLGATTRDGRLHVLQGRSMEIIWELTKSEKGEEWVPARTNSPLLLLTTVDLTQLPALKILDQTEAKPESDSYWGQFEALWPKPGLLVWSGGGGGYWGPMFAKGGIAADVAFRPGPWWGGGGGQLISYDASGASMKFLGVTEVAKGSGYWNFSKPFTVDGLVYLGHQASEWVPNVLPEGVAAPPQTLVKDPNTGDVVIAPVGTWLTRYFLDVVDFADPTTPVLRKPVNIPGQLQGISHGGAILFTSAPHWDPVKLTTDWTEWLDASAYDGVSASLIDSLKLPTTWPHPVTVKDGVVLLGRPGDDKVPHVLESWSLADTGKFANRSRIVLTTPPSNFSKFGDLLVAQAYGGKANLQFFNVTDAATPRPIGFQDLSSCLGYNLDYGDGSITSGLWLPLGPYGVAKLDIKGEERAP